MDCLVYFCSLYNGRDIVGLRDIQRDLATLVDNQGDDILRIGKLSPSLLLLPSPPPSLLSHLILLSSIVLLR